MLDTGAAHKQITAFRTLFLRIFTPKTPLLFSDSHYTSPLALQSVIKLSSMDQTQQNHDKSYEMPFSKSSHSFKGLLKNKNTTTSSNKRHTPHWFSLCRSFIYVKARAGNRTQVFQPPLWLSTQWVCHSSFHSQKGKDFLTTSRVLGANLQSTSSSSALSHPSLEASRRNWSKGSFSCLSLRFYNLILKLHSLWNIQHVQNKNLPQFRSQVLNEYTTPKDTCLKMQNARCTDLPEIAFLATALDASG